MPLECFDISPVTHDGELPKRLLSVSYSLVYKFLTIRQEIAFH